MQDRNSIPWRMVFTFCETVDCADLYCVGFDILKAVVMKRSIVLDITTCSLILYVPVALCNIT
jgi:hypothetical protein